MSKISAKNTDDLGVMARQLENMDELSFINVMTHILDLETAEALCRVNKRIKTRCDSLLDPKKGHGLVRDKRLELKKRAKYLRELRESITKKRYGHSLMNLLREGNLDGLKIYQDVFPLTPEEFRNMKDKRDLLFWPINTGNIPVLKWLHNTYDLTKEDVIPKSTAIRSSDLPGLKWLHNTYGIDTDQAKSLMAYASADGRLDTLKWISKTFEPTHVIDDAYYYAADGPKLNVLKWFHEKFPIPREIVPTVFEFAGSGGDIDTLKWIHKTFNLTSDEAGSALNSAIDESLDSDTDEGHSDAIEWLTETFDL